MNALSWTCNRNREYQRRARDDRLKFAWPVAAVNVPWTSCWITCAEIVILIDAAKDRVAVDLHRDQLLKRSSWSTIAM